MVKGVPISNESFENQDHDQLEKSISNKVLQMPLVPGNNLSIPNDTIGGVIVDIYKEQKIGPFGEVEFGGSQNLISEFLVEF